MLEIYTFFLVTQVADFYRLTIHVMGKTHKVNQSVNCNLARSHPTSQTQTYFRITIVIQISSPESTTLSVYPGLEVTDSLYDRESLVICPLFYYVKLSPLRQK